MLGKDVLRPLLPIIPILLKEGHLAFPQLSEVLELTYFCLQRFDLSLQLTDTLSLIRQSYRSLLRFCPKGDAALTEEVELIEGFHQFVVIHRTALRICFRAQLLI